MPGLLSSGAIRESARDLLPLTEARSGLGRRGSLLPCALLCTTSNGPDCADPGSTHLLVLVWNTPPPALTDLPSNELVHGWR